MIPPVRTSVDWSHPLARDLIGAMREGAAHTRTGRSVFTGSRGSVADVPVDYSRGFSLFALFGGFSGNSWRYLFDSNPGRYLVGHTMSGSYGIAFYANGTQIADLSPPGMDRARFMEAPNRTLTLTSVSDDTRLYGAGALVDQRTGTYTPYVGTHAWYFGQRYTGIDPLDRPIHVCCVWGRALTADEAAWLHAEPYAMFILDRERVYSIPQTLTPWLWRRRAVVLGGGIA